MNISPARQAAYKILRYLAAGRGYAVDLLQSESVSRLELRDRRLAMELVMGVIRWRGDLDFQVGKLSSKPLAYFDRPILDILRLGIYQIRFLRSIPKSAAVNESVELAKAVRKKSAAGLVNAVLRKCNEGAFEKDEAAGAPSRGEYFESACRSIPEWLRERWQKNFGEQAAGEIILASQGTPPTQLRITGCEFDRERVLQSLAESGVEARPGGFGKRSLTVETGNVFQSAAWCEGLIAIQSQASQLVTELLHARPGDSVLDVCAAPGMKSWQLADDMEEGEIVACDRSLRRISRMVRRGWPTGVRLDRLVLDAAGNLPFSRPFDRVLADVPCSGTGTLARNPEIKWRLQPEDILRLAEMQRMILDNALETVTADGRLVYATCSIEPEENELVIAKVLGKRPEFRLLTGGELRAEFPALDELFDTSGYFRTRPGADDGFFAAVLVQR